MAIQTIRIFNHLEGKAYVDFLYDDELPIGSDEFGEKIFEFVKMVFNNVSPKQFKMEVIHEDIKKVDEPISGTNKEIILTDQTKFETQNTFIKIIY